MPTIDALLVKLCAAAIDGDKEAAEFLRKFAPWAAEQAFNEVEGHWVTYPPELP
jgi:hypothetical protein